MENESYENQIKLAINKFFSEEIRNSKSKANYFLKWILDDNSQDSASGDAFFLEKKNGILILGNLYDEEFPETEIPKQELIDLFIKIIDTL